MTKQESKQEFLQLLGTNLIAQLNGPHSLFARPLDSSEESRLRIALHAALDASMGTPEFTGFLHG